MPRDRACGLCGEQYSSSNDALKPILLTCHHTFCKECVSLAEQGGEVTCPSCRIVTPRPCSALPPNYALLHAIDMDVPLNELFERWQLHGANRMLLPASAVVLSSAGGPAPGADPLAARMCEGTFSGRQVSLLRRTTGMVRSVRLAQTSLSAHLRMRFLSIHS